MLVGQVGFKDLTATEAMLDNGMRGERSHNPKLIVCAHKALARWLFKEAEISQIIGWVFADNVSGIMMNKKIGWGGWIRYPLKKVQSKDGSEWIIGIEGEKSLDGKYCFKLIMNRQDI